MERVFLSGPLKPFLISFFILGGLTLLLLRSATKTVAVELRLYCAAGMRKPVDEICHTYEKKYGVRINVEYSGSGRLLSQLRIANTLGDLYLAADKSYILRARDEFSLVAESFPIAYISPVIAVHQGNPLNIRGVADLLRADVRVVTANPEAAAIGKRVRALLLKSGHWQRLADKIKAGKGNSFTSTVTETANAVKLGVADAGIIWDAVAAQFSGMDTIPMRGGVADEITIGRLTNSRNRAAALRFARYMVARDQGLRVFQRHHFRPVGGDLWRNESR